MADNARVVVGCAHGENNPDAVATAFLTAGAALDQGREVVLWLTSEGVRLGLRGYADGIRAMNTNGPPCSAASCSTFAARCHGSVFPIFLGRLVAYSAASPMVRMVLPFGIVIGS